MLLKIYKITNREFIAKVSFLIHNCPEKRKKSHPIQLMKKHLPLSVGMKSFVSGIRGVRYSFYLRFYFITMYRCENEEHHVGYQ